MSNPKNPLGEFTVYTPRHKLIAFDNVEAASNYVLPNTRIGKCGTEIKEGVQCGKAIVVVNEAEDTSYLMRDITWSYDFFSPTSHNTTISAGNFTIADTRGNQFPSFLRRVAKRLGVPETRISFYLVTEFVIAQPDGSNVPPVPTKPLIFYLMDTATGFRVGMMNLFTFNFSMLYNTTGQMPNYSRLDQFTLTNKERNPSRETPAAIGGEAKIVSRAKEDAEKNDKRLNRMNKSAPMRTLKEIFESLEADLNELRFEHKRQLQEFLGVIRPTIGKKIEIPKAKKLGSKGDSLPITFKVNLEEEYYPYPVDNLNLMTEQTETKQGSNGITSITFEHGSTLIDAVNELMKLSTQTADDALEGKAFKAVISTVTDCDGVTKITLNIKKYIIPYNKVGSKDTGPDPKGTVNKLEFVYLDGVADLSVYSLTYSSAPTNEVSILEEDSATLKDDPLWSSSQREQISFERALPSGFSGLRMASSPDNFGLQSAIKGLLVDRLNHRSSLPQNTITTLTIAGNSDLYSDLARNPLAVAEMREDKPKLYRFPEYYPMYITLKVRIGSTANRTISADVEEDEDYWYHTYHYHLSGVTNAISGGSFIQTLRLLSTDDAI